MRILDLAGRLAISLSVLVLPGAAGAAPSSKPVCHDISGYIVITRGKNGGAGDDIIVRRAGSAAGKKSSCAYAAKPGDYVLGGGDDATYFLAMGQQFLALDVGTGPDRQLFIYDVARREKLVDVPYDDSKTVQSREDGFVYWQIGPTPIKPQSCPAAWRQTPANRDAKVAHASREVRFAFADAIASNTGKTSCTRTQDDM